MAEILKPDLCVIGAGSGGLTVAAAARAFKSSVVLIEKGEMGGDCLNTGCVPSKALIAAARHAHLGEAAKPFGINYAKPDIDFTAVHDHIHDVIAGIAPHDSVERFEGLGATVIREHARFTDERTVVAGDTTIRARRFVIATGSRAAVPPVPGLDKVPFLTNESVFDLNNLPARLIVIGGGPIGMELAQAFRRLGSEVTVVEMFEPLGKDDPELTAIALERITAEGVTILGRTGVKSVSGKAGAITVTTEKDGKTQKISGTHLLVAAGRAPNVEALGLEAAGIKSGKRGVEVGSDLRTSNRRVYAIGDVAGGLQFTHVAGYHGGLVVRATLFGLPVREDRDIIPWATYTDPEIANVGLTEAMARERFGDDVKVTKWSYAENDRARTALETEGLVKLVTRKNGRILGCGIAGAHAGELIALFAFAIANKLKVGSLSKFVAPYPTLSELARRVGVAWYSDKIDNPWIGRWLRLIRLLP